MRTSTKNRIVGYLSSRPAWVSGPELERQASEWQTKASVISRRARKLARDGKIERRIWERGVVYYRAGYEK